MRSTFSILMIFLYSFCFAQVKMDNGGYLLFKKCTSFYSTDTKTVPNLIVTSSYDSVKDMADTADLVKLIRNRMVIVNVGKFNEVVKMIDSFCESACKKMGNRTSDFELIIHLPNAKETHHILSRELAIKLFTHLRESTKEIDPIYKERIILYDNAWVNIYR